MRIAASLALLLACVSPARAADIAAEAKIYGVLPLAQDVHLSPDGKSLSLIAGIKGRRTFAIWHLDGGAPTTLATGSLEPAEIGWKGSDRLLASVYFGDFKNFASAAHVTRLLTLDAGGSGHRLVDFSEVNGWGWAPDQFQDQYVSDLPKDPDNVLVYGFSLHSNLATVNVKTGKAAPFLIDGLYLAYGWMADRDGVVRLGEKAEYNEHRFYFRADAKSEWRQVPGLDDKEKEPIGQLAFSATDPNVAYMRFQREDKTAEIRAVDLRDGSVKEVVAAKPGEAAYGIVHGGELIGYDFGDTQPVYIDEAIRKAHATVKKALRDHWVAFVDRSDDGQRYLFKALTAGEGESYWLLDLKSAQLRPLFQAYDDLPAEKIAPITRVSYKARDGMIIPALLTLPRGDRAGPISFVVLPHGGPTAHDTVAFDYLSQFFAALGYGVLQPQFRGSDGHGLALLKAGYGQWGRKMQDDIADGTRWLIGQGYADKTRIALVGFSYGGYAALMGGIRDPDLYACIVAGAPVADLAQFVDDEGHSYGQKTSIPYVRDPDVPLAQISPVKRAREMKAPVLLVQGRVDFTVPAQHSEAMERQLKFYDRPVKAVYFDEADHYFGHETDRVAMLRTVGEFLAEHLSAK